VTASKDDGQIKHATHRAVLTRGGERGRPALVRFGSFGERLAARRTRLHAPPLRSNTRPSNRRRRSAARSFDLTSLSTSSWEGTLSVELPVLGPVPLAGPSWWSALRRDDLCTHPTPPGVAVGFLGLIDQPTFEHSYGGQLSVGR
jgi:hypothetical protein